MSDAGNPAPTPTPTPAWFEGLEPEYVGHAQSRGWDKLDPAAAAKEALKGHVSATRMIGVPAEQLLRLPKDQGDSDGWKQVYQRLGAPTDPKDYDFGELTFGDDSATASFLDTMRAAAAAANMPKGMAQQAAQAVHKWVSDRVASYDAVVQDNIQQADTAIQKNWGENFAAFSVVADRGQQALEQRLGERLAPQVKDAVEILRREGLGEMAREMMRVIGVGLGEDKFVRDNSGTGRPAMTVDMAQARVRELMADKAWTARYTMGDQEARREMMALNRIIAAEG